MTDTIQAISRQMSQDVQTLNTISRNVANVNTAGYKAQRLSTSFAGALNNTSSHQVIDLREGPLVQTGKDLDLALHGPGFFQVEQSGQVLLVRSGAFKIDADGALRTMQDGLVISDSGPIVISDGKLDFRANGEIWQSGNMIGKLRIVNADDASGLRAVSGGYIYKGPLSDWHGSLVQGALEQSNVNVADETIRLMETTRHIESVQRAISTYDKVLEVGINRIGDN